MSLNNSTPTTKPTFILIDGHSLAYRSYYAFAKSSYGGLRTKTGIPTSICFGFVKTLLEVIASEQPQGIIVAFDSGLPTFRHKIDSNYKANRKETPDDFITDRNNLDELLQGFNLQIIKAPENYEADDVLGTLAQKAAAAGYKVKILSGDQDLFQIIDPEKEITILNFNPKSLKSSNKSITEFSIPEVKEKLGILPSQIIDYKALCGDSSDNMPGVKGIGEKTTVKLLETYQTLDQIYAAINEIAGATQTRLINGKEDAYKYQEMATIKTDAPIEIDLTECQLTGFDTNTLIPILEKLEFKTFLGKVNELQQKLGGTITPTTTETPNNQEDDDISFYSPEETDAAAQEETSSIQIRIINTEEKLTELIAILEKHTNPNTPVAWDTETTDLEPRDAALVGIGCCWGTEPDAVAYIPVGHKTGNNLNQKIVLTALRPILESAEYPKTFQNAKFDRLVFKCQGINLAGVVFDPMLASYLINPDNSHGLSDLAMRELGLTLTNYTAIVPKSKDKKTQKTIADIDINTVANYCGYQVYATFQLVPKLTEKLQQTPSVYKLLIEVEQPLEQVLAEVEYTGVRINSDYLKELSQQLETELKKLETQATDIAGEKFNLGSPKQLSDILFNENKLGLSTKYSRKIQTGYSTDAATLEKLQEIDQTGFVELIIEHRTLSKLKSTYVDALPVLVRPDTKRVHTDFNQTATSTGRLSSSNPNLQNIPIRTAFSRQIRKAFLPESNWLMVAADYSQIELRILAHLSQEPVLVQAYQQNEDIHTVTAKLIFEKEDITSEERRLAKTINFGVIYGMGSLKFSRSTGIDKNIANEFIKKFNSRYPQVFDYLEGVKKQAISQGYVETILGRRRYFEFTSDKLRALHGKNPKEIDLSQLKNIGAVDAGLLRSAANAPIQGSSADIIKIAMVRLHQILQQYQARLLLQVHDELVFEVPPQEWEELQPQIKSVMENAVKLSVPLVVDVNAGENWMETK
ncbi:MAG TPA: DNA polymerase I [Nostocaceae cyanobacterium]|nr:DNA polymerase I [Nostocaceae cyanobacterium]